MEVRLVVPCYNSESFIEETFNNIRNSLAKFSICNCHVYFIDDGSSDSTFSKLNKLCADCDSFYVFTKKNGGEGSARNYALDIEKNSYEYVFYVDSDDVLMTNFNQALAKLEETKADLLVCSYIQTDSSSSKLLKKYNQPEIHYSKEKAIEQFLFRNFVPGIGNTFFKKSEIRFSKFKLGADSLYTYENLIKFNHIVGFPIVVYNYKIRVGSSMDSKNYDNIKVALLIKNNINLNFETHKLASSFFFI